MAFLRRIVTLATHPRIAKSAAQIALVVGTVLNLVNQGGPLLAGNASVLNLLMNYVVPYCVATYSAVRNEMSNSAE